MRSGEIDFLSSQKFKNKGMAMMKSYTLPWSVFQLNRMQERGTLSLEYYLQRPSDQWDLERKSLWIHTLISNLPKYPIFTRLENDVYYVLEGKQRIGTNESYLRDEFALSKDTPDVFDETMQETHKIAGKKFSELPEMAQSLLVHNSMLHYRLEGTDEEIEEFFERINNGVGLSKLQQAKARMGRKIAEEINLLETHPFVKEKCAFSKVQLKNSDDEASLVQTMMLLDHTYEIKALSAKYVAEYASQLKKRDWKALFDTVHNILDYLDVSFSEQDKKLTKKVNFPMLMLTAKNAIQNDVSPHIFQRWAKTFKEALIDKGNIPTGYKQFGGQGSVKKEKVLGRVQEMKKHFQIFLSQSKEEEKAVKAQ